MAIGNQYLPSRPNKPRWSDLAETEEEDNGGEELKILLPPTQVIGPDKKGIKKVIEYNFNDQGKMVKVTTTSRVRKIVTREKKQVLERRRSWAKFGEAVDDEVGTSLTAVSTEEIFLERPKPLGSTAKESRTAEESLGQIGNKGAILMLCRTCGKKGDHWTAKCPYKDLTTRAEDLNFNDKTVMDNANSASSSGISKSGSYIPPSKRFGADRNSSVGGSSSAMRHNNRNDENAVKVSNLSENAEEEDLRELFGAFGPLTRVHVAVDRPSGFKRGFGFVNFAHREDAERAINKLNGYGYDNLILAVEWAPARSK